MDTIEKNLSLILPTSPQLIRKKEENKIIVFLTILFIGAFSVVFSIFLAIPFIVSIFSFFLYRRSRDNQVIKVAYKINVIFFFLSILLIILYCILALIKIGNDNIEGIIVIIICCILLAGLFGLIKLNNQFFLMPFSQHHNLFLPKKTCDIKQSETIEALTKLVQLKESGLINDSEFTQAKKRILSDK